MDRRRAAAALFALAACFACATAAPTATNHTALDLAEGPTQGCYYNFQHYGEGDRIMTNEPCLNCTCHNRMLMCYLRVCPFTKPIGQDCKVEKRADQCCPIVTCPDVPVDLLTSTSTSSPAEYGTTGVSRQDKYGCSINGKYFSEGSKVPPTPNKPCEHCYCIRNMTTCVMQECTLHVDGCTPIYHKDVCCPVRYSCDHPEDEIPLLDDMTTTVRPTPGFLLTTTTTVVPVTQPSQECIHEDQIFPDGAHIKTEKACEHCYCMKGDIVCVVQGCGTPMENEGKNCTALPLRFGQCCPDTYICEGDEHGPDRTTEVIDQTTTPPRRVGIEGSGYRNEPDEPVKEIELFETNVEGSGDENTFTTPVDIIENSAPDKQSPEAVDEILPTTEKEIYINPGTESETERNYVPDKDTSEVSYILPDQNQMLYTTEANTDFVSTTREFKTTIADKHQIIDEFISQKDATITTESAFRKEDNDIVADEILLHSEEHKGTTSVGDLTEETYNKVEPDTGDVEDYTRAPEYDNKATTESIKYTQGDMDKTTQKDNIETETQTEVTDKKNDEELVPETTSEKDVPTISTNTVSDKLVILDITTINPAHNEIYENTGITHPARIPGEGDCLLNGVTYTNNTNVPRANNCHTSCKCVSSIIKCDPIICSPPPEYMENMNDCQPIYDSPDSCCPTYVCSAKETIPPQSHSQMSGTESPKPLGTIECDKNECALSENDKQTLGTIEKHEQGDCSSGNCEDDNKNLPPKIPEDCSDNKCQVSPIVACEGENCDIEHTDKLDSTADSESDLKQETPSNCNDKDGCKSSIDIIQDLCTDEICRRKDKPNVHNELPSECSGTECNTLNDVVTSANEEEQSTESVLNKQGQDLEPSTPTKAVIEESITEVSPAEDISQTEIINIPVTSEPDLQTEIDKLFGTENEPEHSKMPTTQTVPETEMDENKTIELDVVTGQEKEKVTEPQNLPEMYTDAGTTEMFNVEQKVTEKEQTNSAKESLNTELPEFMETKLEDTTKNGESLTTESMNVDDSDIHKTKSEDSFTTLPNLPIEEKITEKPEPHIETSHTEDEIKSSTIDSKLHLVTETPTISAFETEKTDSAEKTIQELLPKSTELPEVEFDKNEVQYNNLLTTPRLPVVEIDTDIDKNTFEESHTTQVFYETSTHKDVNIYDHYFNESDRMSTEAHISQSEISERPEAEQPHEMKTDKIGNELQSITEKQNDYTIDSTTASGVDGKTEPTIISSDVTQPIHVSEDELTTISNENIIKENQEKEEEELLEYSTIKSENPEYNMAHKISDKKPLISIEYPTTEQIKIEETEQPVAEGQMTKQPESLDTKSDEIIKVTEYPAIHNEETATKISDISLEMYDQTSTAPEKERTTMDESELSIKEELSSESPSAYTNSDDDQNKEGYITELPKISITSTETISTSPKVFVDIETEKSVEAQNEENLFDDAQLPNTLITGAHELTTKYSDRTTEKSEILTTEFTTKYMLNEDINMQQPSSETPKLDDKYSENQETQTILLKEESSTISHGDSVEITESQTNIPVVDDDKLGELITKTPHEILTTEQSDKKHEIPSKEDSFLGHTEVTSLDISTESQVINSEVVTEEQLHIETTLKPHNDKVQTSPEKIEEQILNESTTLKPNEEKVNIEDSLKQSTPFVDYTTSKDLDKVTDSPNTIEEKDREQDVEEQTAKADKDEKLSEITEKPSIDDISSSQSTKESATIKAFTEEITVHASEPTTENYNEKKQEISNVKPEEPKMTSKLEEVATTERISNVHNKDVFTESPETNDYVTLPIENHKLDEHMQIIPDKDVPQLQTMPPVLVLEKDKVITDIPHTDTGHQTVSEIMEGELGSTTKPSYDIISEDDGTRVPTPDVYVTQSQYQTSDVPEQSDKQEVSSDAILTSESPEKISTAQIDTSASIPQPGGIDKEETHDQSSQTIFSQTDSSENVKPTEILTVSELSDLTTENPSTSKKEIEIQPTEEKKPSTESIISSDDNSDLEHNVPVFVQREETATEMSLQEITTVFSNLFNVENDEQLKITEAVPTKPQDIVDEVTRAETTTEDIEKETPFAVTTIGISTESSKVSDSTKHTLTDEPIDIAQTETSTYFTELKESEGPGYIERKTTETSIIPITERQESPKPISVLEITEDNAPVAEQNESDIFSDVSTKLPDKDMIDLNEVTTSLPEEELTNNVKIEQDITVKPDSHVEIGEKEVTKLPEHTSIVTEDKTELFDKNKLPNISPESVEKTSLAPIEQEVHSEEAHTLLPTDKNVPTEYVDVHKDLRETTTTKTLEHGSNLETMTNSPVTIQKHQEVEETTELESTYSKTTPSSVELEEHTHLAIDESSLSVPTSDVPTRIEYESHEPERGDMPDNEKQVKPSDATSIDLGDKEQPVTSYQEITDLNLATTISPVQNNIEKESSTDINFPISTKSEQPDKIITTIHDEEIILSSSPQTLHEKDLYSTENDMEVQQISSTTHGPVLSTEKDLPTSSEIPIKPEIVQSTVSEKEIIFETSQATTGKFAEVSSTDSSIDKLSGLEEKLTSVSPSSSPVPELPKPVFNEEPIEDIATPDFPSSGAGGYGQEPDYVEEDQAFGPGTCRYGGKVYVSAQQIPRDDPCDFCFCFRSDIICLQQSCPPPIHGCHEEPIQGFCCPRYECPVSMATTLNMTTTTTTTTTTLPPHFLPHAYKGAAQRRGCQIKGHTYKVGEVVRASSGPCLHCTCGGDGQMKCDPKVCTPEPMLRQMIAAAVSAKRRR